jgi:hypothetical protein
MGHSANFLLLTTILDILNIRDKIAYALGLLELLHSSSVSLAYILIVQSNIRSLQGCQDGPGLRFGISMAH